MLSDGAEGAPVRGRHALAHDTRRDRLVLHGGLEIVPGQGRQAAPGDTWEWDGTAWERVEPQDPEGDGGPGSREGHAMVYDPERGRVVMFGGELGGASVPAEVWEWDGGSWERRWAPEPGGDPGPEGRSQPALAFDPDRRSVVLFGGASDGCLDDLWSWNGATWTRLSPDAPEEGDRPPGLEQHALMFHSGLRAMVLAGTPCGTDTAVAWSLSGGVWRRRRFASGHGPQPTKGHALAGGGREGGLLLFGGDRHREERVAHTLVDDVQSWRLLVPEDPEGDRDPPPRSGHTLVYDAARRRFVLLGGVCGELALDPVPCDGTWEWTGGSWEERLPEDPEGDGDPEPRFAHGAAYAVAQERTVLFGGTDGLASFDDTWQWDGRSWSDAAPETVPPARSRHALAYDAARQRVVLFGGESDGGRQLGDTWEWDGLDWREVVAEDPEDDGEPAARSGHAMAYHPVRQRVVLLGGCRRQADGELERMTCPADPWEWDGSSWERLAVDDVDGDGSLPSRSEHGVAYDEARAGLVQFGGVDPAGHRSGETWLWQSDDRHRPAHRWATMLPAAAVLPGTSLEHLAVAVTAAGLGEVDGARHAGLELLAWEEGAWSLLAERRDGPSGRGAPPLTPLAWATSDAARARALLYAPDGALHLALTPVGPDGTGLGRLWVDYAEVRLRYRIGTQ